MTVWGSGNPKREFLHVDDMAAACVFVMELDQTDYQSNTEPMLSHINVGTGKDVTIRELAELMAKVTGYEGRITFDPSQPDGSPRKLLNVDRLGGMGWRSTIELEQGLSSTYQWFQDNLNKFKC